MKVIYPEKVNTITASSEDTNWPVSNLLDNYRVHPWKSTETGSASLTVSMLGGANAVAIFNVPGVDTIRVQVSNDTDGTVFDETYDQHVIDTYTAFFTNSAFDYPDLWAEYPYQTLDHTITITFTMVNTSDVVSVGVLRAGLAKEFREPESGIKEVLKDFSVVKELNNGAFYVRKRNIIRTFAGTFWSNRDRDFYVFRDLYQTIGQQPFAAKIVDDNSQNWNIFGRFSEPISGEHRQGNWSHINFSIEEVI